MHNSREVYWKTALRILNYIIGVPGKSLLYKKHEHLWIEACSDSNYVGDKRDRNSTYGYCTYVEGNLVTWRSKKQSVISFYC